MAPVKYRAEYAKILCGGAFVFLCPILPATQLPIRHHTACHLLACTGFKGIFCLQIIVARFTD
jgi:hypothetical protein